MPAFECYNLEQALYNYKFENAYVKVSIIFYQVVLFYMNGDYSKKQP